ncbi:MAG TPA: hypothetical protein VHO69_05890 [Phototrophicaceae bacterium]|nr:hypothetical protein [Phototrophicaceae bacterium]
MSDADIERGSAAMQAAIAAQYPQPEQPRLFESTFVVRAYWPPP